MGAIRPAYEPSLPWLLATARNLIGDAYRRRDREWRLVDAIGRKPSPDGVVDRVRDVLAALPDATREVLMLTYWDGLPAAQAAALLGCSPGAIWVRLHRARRAFAVAWEERE